MWVCYGAQNKGLVARIDVQKDCISDIETEVGLDFCLKMQIRSNVGQVSETMLNCFLFQAMGPSS